MNTLTRLRELARNLYWTWHPEVVEIFRDLEPELWRELNHNPVAFLARVPSETVEPKASALVLEARISQAFHRMRNYLQSSSTWGSMHAGRLRANPVAYFSAEFGLHESLPLYSGGLGVLAGDHLKAASDLGLPLVGIGLFYAQGYFTQRLDESGWQQEKYFTADPEVLPLRRATDAQGQVLRIEVETGEESIAAGLWTAEVGRCRLLLLDTDVEENRRELRHLTAQLYGGDAQTRIRQELVLGVEGMRALDALGLRPGVVR